jgi:hypothetical protein
MQWMQQIASRVTKLETSFTGVKDSLGNTRIKTGLLANGDYGIALIDGLGNTDELLPSVRGFYVTGISVTSTSYASPSGSPSVTAQIGANGDAIVTVSCNMETTNTNDTAYVGLTFNAPPTRRCGAARDPRRSRTPAASKCRPRRCRAAWGCHPER